MFSSSARSEESLTGGTSVFLWKLVQDFQDFRGEHNFLYTIPKKVKLVSNHSGQNSILLEPLLFQFQTSTNIMKSVCNILFMPWRSSSQINICIRY